MNFRNLRPRKFNRLNYSFRGILHTENESFILNRVRCGCINLKCLQYSLSAPVIVTKSAHVWKLCLSSIEIVECWSVIRWTRITDCFSFVGLSVNGTCSTRLFLGFCKVSREHLGPPAARQTARSICNVRVGPETAFETTGVVVKLLFVVGGHVLAFVAIETDSFIAREVSRVTEHHWHYDFALEFKDLSVVLNVVDLNLGNTNVLISLWYNNRKVLV